MTDAGLHLPIGTYDDAKAMLGHKSDVRTADCTVNDAMTRFFCAMAEDANLSYWDRGFAERVWGGLIAPPSTLLVWFMPPWWRPDQEGPVPVLAARVPLPGDSMLSIKTDTEYFEPIRVGDHLSMVEEFVDVTEEKQTRLGSGHFVTTVATVRRQDDTVVARHTHVLLRFKGSA
jgi:MaoC dehydratase-like protein